MMARLKAILVVTMLAMILVSSASAQDEQVHIVLPGENLFRISQQYGVDVDTIAQANDITNTWRIYAGQKLIIPDLSAPADTTADTTTDTSAETSGDAAPIIVQPAESSSDTSADSADAALAAPTPEPEYHVVTYGQSLAQIAQSYHMSLEQIAKLNDITNPDLIYAGQKLIVTPGSADSSAPQPDDLYTVVEGGQSFAPDVVNTVTHIVQPGETLATIADLYGISFLQIAQANNIYNADQVSVGQELLVPGASVIEGADYSFISAPAAPAPRIGVGKEIIVDLSDSRVYAYEDGKLVRNVLGSPGLPGSPTVQGSFTVQRKYEAQTMTGPGYYLPAVPYVMYFYAGYALHGTYWHNNFGHPMSHGCVNLPTPEAEWFYGWTEIGTPVYVQA